MNLIKKLTVILIILSVVCSSGYATGGFTCAKGADVNENTDTAFIIESEDEEEDGQTGEDMIYFGSDLLSTFTFEMTEDGLMLYQYTGSSSEVVIPGSAVIDGQTYSVYLAASNVFEGNSYVTSITFDSSGTPVWCAIEDISLMFANCPNLTSVDMSGLNLEDITNAEGMFEADTSLIKIVTPMIVSPDFYVTLPGDDDFLDPQMNTYRYLDSSLPLVTALTVPQPQSITNVKSVIKKRIGCSSFYLGAEANTDLTYESSNTKYVKVTSEGKVKIRGKKSTNTTVKITIRAAASSEYQEATKTVKIKILAPKKPTIKSYVRYYAYSVELIWKKNSNANGYQVQISSRSSFKTKRTINVRGYKKNRVIISGLSNRRGYYCRVRTYAKVNGKKYYSAWSKKTRKG